MRRIAPWPWYGAIALALWALVDADLQAVPSQWQGPRYAETQDLRVAPLDLPETTVLSTGGTGGMFGQGDLRFDLRDVAFQDADTGWTLGRSGVLRTTDGGGTWARFLPAPDPPVFWEHVEVGSDGSVWVMQRVHGRAEGRLFRSRDGGFGWQEMLPGQIRGASDLMVHGETVWVLCGQCPSWLSRDGGNTWGNLEFNGLLHGAIAVQLVAGDSLGVSDVAYVLGLKRGQPVLVKSRNGGRDWDAAALPDDLPQAIHRYRMFFADAQRGWLGLPNGRLFRTDDGGASWQRVDVPWSEAVTALWFSADGDGLVAVWNGYDPQQGQPRNGPALYWTPDAGSQWHALLTGKKQVNGMALRAADRVVAVGDVPGFQKSDLVVQIVLGGDR